MVDHGLVGELDEGFGEREGLVVLLDLWACLLGGRGRRCEVGELRTRGRNRVPKPPTRMRAVDRTISTLAYMRPSAIVLPFILSISVGCRIHDLQG